MQSFHERICSQMYTCTRQFQSKLSPERGQAKKSVVAIETLLLGGSSGLGVVYILLEQDLLVLLLGKST